MSRPWSPARTPAFWILLPPVVLSALVAGVGLVVLAAIGTPWTAAAVVPTALLVGVAWVWFLLRVADPVERRPGWLVAFALSWGAGLAVLVGGGSGVFLDELLGTAVSPEFAATWGAALLAPTAEEAAKAAGVVALLLIARPYLTTAWSGAVYGALIGVGFTVLEDVGYGLTMADEALPDDVVAGAGTLALRLLVPGISGHPLFSALAGAGIGYAWLRRDVGRGRRLAVLSLAGAGAWTAHFAVNSPIGPAFGSVLERFSAAAPWFGFFAVVLAPAIPGLWWLWRLRRHDARVVLGRAAAHAPLELPLAEVDVLAGLRSRVRAGRRVRHAHGRAAGRAARRLRRARLRLAAAFSRPYRGLPPVLPPAWFAEPVRTAWVAARDARLALAAELSAVDQPAMPQPTGRAVRRVRRWAVPALLVAAVGGVLWWPVALLAAAAGAGWAWALRDGGAARVEVAAVLAGLGVGYLWLTNIVLSVLTAA